MQQNPPSPPETGRPPYRETQAQTGSLAETENPMVQKALALARQAHAGQTDQGGAPYIGHPLAVAASVQGEDAKTVALLHDIVEDTPVTLAQLAQEGFPDRVVDAVRVLTKTGDMPYGVYLAQVKENRLACVVKLADLRHNMDTGRLNRPLTQADEARLQKYRDAEVFLRG